MSYNHLTIEERTCIYQFSKLGMSQAEIAKALGRSRSTICRELRRNSHMTGRNLQKKRYSPTIAQKKYEERRTRCHRNSSLTTEMKDYISKRIQEHWSPEQISHRDTEEFEHLPSTSTIYRHIHRNHIHRVTMKSLRRKGKFKRPAETRGKFNDKGRRIKKRPKHIYKREEIGHWEADTVESGRRCNRICLSCL